MLQLAAAGLISHEFWDAQGTPVGSVEIRPLVGRYRTLWTVVIAILLTQSRAAKLAAAWQIKCGNR